MGRNPFLHALTAALVSLALSINACDAQTGSTGQSATVPGATTKPSIDAREWPRAYSVDNFDFVIYRPQIDSWVGDELKGRAAISIKTGEVKDEDGQKQDQLVYGVLWFSARTETDRAAREVTLTNITVDEAHFPTAKHSEGRYLTMVRKVVRTEQAVSLDQIESNLALARAGDESKNIAINSASPDIIFSFEPSILVLVDGEPQWKSTTVAGVERALNTPVILFKNKGQYWLRYASSWASSTEIDSDWAFDSTAPDQITRARGKLPLGDERAPTTSVPPEIARQLAAGKSPKVYVRTGAAELIDIDGDPEFEHVPGTHLSYISNTPADVFVNESDDNAWYILISGRWFTSHSIKGPWSNIAPSALPKDFVDIPSDGPKGAVLASVSGTPEAEESLVANSVPQTATIDRTQAKFAARYDGAPKFVPIEGTPLDYAKNSATPIIRVALDVYYALDNGVWFSASHAAGPWMAATSVPPVIYKIPASSPLHYVTYAYVYDTSGNAVHVGYTPGYYGTVVSDGVVVYGTGYPCDSWIGNEWYGCPETYGYGASFGFSDAGWGLAFGYGWLDPWYGPWWGPWAGYFPCCSGGAVAENFYGRWGEGVVKVNAYTGRRAAAAGGIRYDPQTGSVVAGTSATATNIYTGEGITGATRSVIDTNTGRIASESAIATRSGAKGDISDAGYGNYDGATSDVNRDGAVDVNGDIYAGRDGNVYKRNADGDWEKIGRNGDFQRTSNVDPSLYHDSLARDRGLDRDRMTGGGFEPTGAERPQFNRQVVGGNVAGPIGGMRGIGRAGFWRR